MSINLSTIIDSVFPSSGVDSVVVGSSVILIFDREIDEFSILDGNFFVTGPETDTWSGPDLAKWDIGQDGKDALRSPGLDGIVPGTLTFNRINLGDLNEFTGLDIVGSGLLYRTEVVFTPEKAFTPDTKYTVYLTGDEDNSDAFKTGIKPQSVFDAARLAGSGSDDLTFTGTYSDPAEVDTIYIRIVESGVTRDATFEYWFDSNTTPIGPISAGTHVFLSKGVYLEFGDGFFVADDEFYAVLAEQQPFIGSLSWGFETGSGSIQLLPTSTSTSVIGNLVPVTSVNSFTLTSIKPVDRATNLPITTKQIVLQFSNAVDASTVTSERIRIVAFPVNGDPNVLEEREIFKDVTVVGNKIILDF